MASGAVFKRDKYEQKITFQKMEDNTWYQTTPQKKTREIVSSTTPAERKTLSARHARHTARIEPKPRRLLCPDGLPLSTSVGVCANGGRTKIYKPKTTKVSQNTSICTHLTLRTPPPRYLAYLFFLRYRCLLCRVEAARWEGGITHFSRKSGVLVLIVVLFWDR